MIISKDEQLIKLKSKLDKIEYDCQFKAYPLVKNDILEIHLFWNNKLEEMQLDYQIRDELLTIKGYAKLESSYKTYLQNIRLPFAVVSQNCLIKENEMIIYLKKI